MGGQHKIQPDHWRPHNTSKSKLSLIPSGKPLKLREGVYKQMKEREWIFNRAEKDIIFLAHKSGAYGVAVRNEDIDWDELHNFKEGKE
jgi:hypothetical protein